MPGYPAIRSFTNNVSNNRNPLSGNDYTNKKRAETLYENISLNTNTNNIQSKKINYIILYKNSKSFSINEQHHEFLKNLNSTKERKLSFHGGF